MNRCFVFLSVLLLGARLGVGAPSEQVVKLIFDNAPAKASVAPKKPRRVLIWNTPAVWVDKDPHKGECAFAGAEAFTAIGKKTSAFEPVVSDDLTNFFPEALGKFDAIVLNNTAGDWAIPAHWEVDAGNLKALGRDDLEVMIAVQSNLTHFVTSGKGLLVLHYALTANTQWKEFKDLCGATFAGFPWNEEVGVTVEDPQSPLVAAFGGKNFRVAEEICEYGDPYNRSKVRVLLSLDPATSNMGVRWINRGDGDFPLAWVGAFGKGRVFTTAFGHRTEVFSDPRFLRFYLDAIQFLCGDLDAPTAPRPERPARKVPGTDPAPNLPGFVSLFDGSDLAGWQGDSRLWSVRDGVILAQGSPDLKAATNTSLIWKDEVEDFELRLKFKLEKGDPRITFRGLKGGPGEAGGGCLAGTQARLSISGAPATAVLEHSSRGTLADFGQKAACSPNGEKQVVSALGDPAKLSEAMKANDWNEYAVLAKGPQISVQINGVPICELDDGDAKRLHRGWLALELGGSPATRVQFKEIYLRRL